MNSFINKKHSFRIILSLLSLFSSLVIVELFLAIFLPQKIFSLSYKMGNPCFKKSEVTVWTIKPNCEIRFKDFDTGESIYSKTNGLGYRNIDFEIKKREGEKRILIEGDSFIVGWGVKDKNHVSYLLEKKLKEFKPSHPLSNAKVINVGGNGGFGPDGYFLHLKSKGMNLEPDLVIFSVFVGDDLSDLDQVNWFGKGTFGEPLKAVSKTTLVDDSGYLIPMKIPFIYRIPVVRESHIAIFFTKVFSQTINAIKTYRYKKSPVEKRTSIYKCVFSDSCQSSVQHLYSKLLATIKASNNLMINSYHDGKLHFVVLLIPADFQISPEAIKKFNYIGIPANITIEANPNPQRHIKQMLEKENISYIDLLTPIRNQSKKLYFNNDTHWNANGHESAATEIAKWLEINYKGEH